MGGEHGFHQDVGETGGDVFGGEPGMAQTEEVRAPETRFGGGSGDLLALAADLGGDVLLDQVEQLKGGRVHLPEAGRERLGGGGTVRRGRGGTAAVRPGDETREVVLAEFLQDLTQAVHQEDEIVVDFGQTGFEQFGGWYAHPGGRLQGGRPGGKDPSQKKARGPGPTKAFTGLYKDKPFR